VTFAAGPETQTVTVSRDRRHRGGTKRNVPRQPQRRRGATIVDAQATGTITNDDASPLPTLFHRRRERWRKGNAGTVNAVFNVTLSAASTQAVTVGLCDAANGTATAGTDYQAGDRHR